MKLQKNFCKWSTFGQPQCSEDETGFKIMVYINSHCF